MRCYLWKSKKTPWKSLYSLYIYIFILFAFWFIFLVNVGYCTYTIPCIGSYGTKVGTATIDRNYIKWSVYVQLLLLVHSISVSKKSESTWLVMFELRKLFVTYQNVPKLQYMNSKWNAAPTKMSRKGKLGSMTRNWNEFWPWRTFPKNWVHIPI